MKLYPYQVDIIAKFDRTRESKRRIILVAPTGSGKTIIGGAVIQKEIANYGSVLVLSHRREITKQTSEKLQRSASVTASFRPGLVRDRLSGCRSHRSRHCIGGPFRATRCICRPPIWCSSTNATTRRRNPGGQLSRRIRTRPY